MIAKGYKQTEVGIIPEDWSIVNVGDVLSFKNGLNKESEFFGYGTPIVNYMDVFNNQGLYKKNIKGKVFLNSQEKRNFSARKGDVFFTRTSETQEEIGMSAVLLEEIEGCVFSGFILRGRPITKKVLFDYYKYSFTPQYIRNQIISTSSFTTRALTNGRYLSNILLALPPTLKEQEAIAKVLSDTDNLIQGLENVIAKKKAIKKGTMQQLLTPPNKGGKRLSGFSGEWETNKLKSISSFRRGSFPQPYGLDKWYDDISGMPFIQVVDVAKNKKLKADTKRKISKLGAEYSVFVKKGTVVLTIQGSIGRICITQYDAYIDRTLLIFQSILDVFDKYMFMMLVDQKFEIEKEKAPGGIIKTITKEALSSFEISYPSTRKEQEAIATILSDMDKGIEALEVKKEKYIQLKKGLAQELLTGKTRLV